MSLAGWYVGHVIASVVIVIVVGLVGWILSLARRIGGQASEIVGAVGEIRQTTAPLPKLATLNGGLGAVVDHATVARAVLAGDQ